LRGTFLSLTLFGSGVIVDGFYCVVFLWLASTVLVTAIGYFRGQAADAMTAGVLLGPIALVVTAVVIVRGRRALKEPPTILKITDADRRRHAVAVSETRRRWAA
jgi:hypothetical protein